MDRRRKKNFFVYTTVSVFSIYQQKTNKCSINSVRSQTNNQTESQLFLHVILFDLILQNNISFCCVLCFFLPTLNRKIKKFFELSFLPNCYLNKIGRTHSKLTNLVILKNGFNRFLKRVNIMNDFRFSYFFFIERNTLVFRISFCTFLSDIQWISDLRCAMVISPDELEFKDFVTKEEKKSERAISMNCDLMCFNFTVVISIVLWNAQKMRKRFAKIF